MKETKRQDAVKAPLNGGKLDFQELYHLFQPKILRYMTRLVGGHEAEDLTQELFFKVSRALNDFKGKASVSTWIYRIATNTALDRLRKPSVERSKQGATAENRSPDKDLESEAGSAACRNGENPASTESSLINKEMMECLRKYIDQLPMSQRTVVVLSVLEGMKNGEIAKILGITLETVKIRLHRGRSGLAKELEKHCGWFRDARGRMSWDGMIL
jgi:RNA polymerase sigma-70 factor (ECF subfamily)